MAVRVNREKVKRETREYEKRKKEREDDAIRKHLISASKRVSSEAKWRSPFDAFDLSLEKQAEMLEAYYWLLAKDEMDFIEKFGKDGHSSARWIRLEMSGTLDSLARIRVKISRGDDDKPKRRKR